MKAQGFEDVYHLEGGVLKYLEEVEQEESMWQGECFVFDSRVAVKHGLEQGQYDQCFACRYPITTDEKQNENYIQGVSCHRCFDQYTDEQRSGFAERERQINLANQRGEKHIGGHVKGVIDQRRKEKVAGKKAQSEK